MYYYYVTQSTPEGLDYQWEFQHKIEFTQEAFNDICADAFIHGYKEHKKTHDYILKSCYDDEAVTDYFNKLGFVYVQRHMTACFDLDPWSCELPHDKLLKYYQKENLG